MIGKRRRILPNHIATCTAYENGLVFFSYEAEGKTWMSATTYEKWIRLIPA